MKFQELGLVCFWLYLVNGKVRINNHGYEGVVISIGDSVREDPHLLKRLQQYLTVTSQALFKATRNQIYFRDFVVVIPEHWSTEKHYKSATDADVDHPQFIIDRPNPAYGQAPYVKQYAECGQPGLYIHLTPKYLLDEEITFRWGLPEKTLVHEWAHLRWGLFDEYPIDRQDTPFYRLGGRWEPVRCSGEVEGVLRSEEYKGDCPFDMYTGRPSYGCKFYPRMKNNKAASSIMFMQYLESITDFCDHPKAAPGAYRHNVYAPNRQNRLCLYRSAWEVMRKHSDFKSVRSPLSAYTDTTPRFHFVQVKPKRRVLVLDASGSMTGSSLHTLRQAASNYILTSVETGSWLGIVQFNTFAKQLAPMLEIKSDLDRLSLINSLPYFAEGKTSIGAGLAAGLQTLEDSKMGKGGTLILITDGKENKSPWIKDIKPYLMRNNVMVHALAYTQQAEASIAQLAGETEGRTFFFTGESNSTSLVDSLAATVEAPSKQSSTASISSEALQVYSNKPYTGYFVIDKSVGKGTLITFVYTGDIRVAVDGPETTLTHNNHTYHNSTHGMLTVSIPGLAKIGQWKYEVTSNSPYSNVLVHVQSQARVQGTDILTVKSWVSADLVRYEKDTKLAVFADVSQGYAPVLGAKVKVAMERPGSGVIELDLLDDGIGSDLLENDGVYSAYVLPVDLQGDGRYSMKVKVIGEDAATKVIVEGHQSGAIETGQSENSVPSTETAPLGEFQRVTTAGEFRLEGFPHMSGPQKDEIPPARIGDLTVLEFDQDTGLTRLEWTAVGDDMGRGRASGYKLFISSDMTDLVEGELTKDTTELYNGTLPIPSAVGEREELNFTMWNIAENDTVYLSIQAFDDSDNHGILSNIISISYVTDLSIKREPAPQKMSFLYVVVAPMVGFLLFLVLLTILCLLCTRRDGKQKGIFHCDSNLSLESITTDFPHMNYRVDGEYVTRSKENNASWEIN